jgi:predicted ATPase
LENYLFYTKRIGEQFPEIKNYPAFVLVESDWDDFSFKTSYILVFYKNSRSKYEIGDIKIFEKGSINTKTPLKFKELSDKYFSLGQDNYFYFRLQDQFNIEQINYILEALNDISYCKGLLSEIEDESGFQISLIRYSEAQKALNEAKKILLNIPIENSFDFTFTTQLNGFTNSHKIEFDFKELSDLPKRIVAFIGKNGSGKTQVLSRLASSLSGTLEKGTFSTKYLPPFSRVIAVSYSLFDKFDKPKLTKSFSYYYCGIQTKDKLLTERQIEKKIITSFQKINKNNNLHLLYKYISELLGSEVADRFFGDDYIESNENVKIYDKEGASTFSSGQIILILVLSEILANIRNESLILFDEPETHLHPNAISKLISVIYKILNKFNSFAIIATHSPQIVQEIPSSSIYLFSKSENTKPVRKVGIETFGENLTTLTEKIFQTAEIDEYYKQVLERLAQKFSAEEILNLFKEDGNPLSLNAKIYLENLYPNQR